MVHLRAADPHGDVRPEYRSTYELRGRLPLDDEQRRTDRDRAFANQAPAL